MTEPNDCPRLNRWLQIRRNDRSYCAFAYHDDVAGPSAKGGPVSEPPRPEEIAFAVDHPLMTFRFPLPDVEELSDDRVRELGLPARPPWMAIFDMPDHPWRADARLDEARHESCPDDYRANFFFRDISVMEQMWVRLEATDQATGGYRGRLMNTPNHTDRVAEGDAVVVRSVPGQTVPFYLNETAVLNCATWLFRCSCGCDFFDEESGPTSENLLASSGDLSVVLFQLECPLCSELMLAWTQGYEAYDLLEKGGLTEYEVYAPLPLDVGMFSDFGAEDVAQFIVFDEKKEIVQAVEYEMESLRALLDQDEVLKLPMPKDLETYEGLRFELRGIGDDRNVELIGDAPLPRSKVNYDI